MIGIPLGLLYSNAFEWVIHKYILHGRGKNKKSFWSFHWHDHHQTSRKNEMVDDNYTEPKMGINPRTKEIAALALASAIHLPLFPIAPFFTATVVYSSVRYYRLHRRAHLDPDWAKEHLPWHYDHHMGPNQHSNWCVTHPFFDYIMGTREEYIGTDRYADDQRARKARAAAADHGERSACEHRVV